MSIIFSSCSEYNNPASQVKSPVVKTEVKWEIDPASNTKKNKIYMKEFDINGNLVSYTEYFDTGEILSNSTFEKQDDLISKEEKTTFNKNGIIVNTNTYKYVYNSSGKVAEKETISLSGHVTSTQKFTYDNVGNISSQTNVDVATGNNLQTKYTYKYDSKGLLTERTISDGNTVQRDSLRYIDDRYTVEIINLDELGKVEYIRSYLYNTFGFVTSEMESLSDGSIKHKYIFEYVYHN